MSNFSPEKGERLSVARNGAMARLMRIALGADNVTRVHPSRFTTALCNPGVLPDLRYLGIYYQYA